MRRIFLSSKDFRITASPNPFPAGTSPTGGAGPSVGGPNEQHAATNEPGPNLQSFTCTECGKTFSEGGAFKDHLREDHNVRHTVN